MLTITWLSGQSQSITILDQATKQPLVMASLSSQSPKEFITTDAKGWADISIFKEADSIEIRYVGYRTEFYSYASLLAEGPEIYLKESGVSLDGIVISATKYQQNKRDVPGKISTITASKIELYNPQTAADLLGTSGEVFIQKSQLGGGSPMIRGFSTNRLLIAVDGIRMNTAIFRSGNLQNVISLDPFAIEHTEVFFGPGSVIYGSDAIGGVMSFQTLTPRFAHLGQLQASGRASLRYSSANSEKTGHFDLNMGWKKWALNSSVTHFNYGDLKMGSNGPDEYLRTFYVIRQGNSDIQVANENPMVQIPTVYSQTNVMQKIRFRPNQKWNLTYGFHYSTTSDYPRYDRLLRLRNGLPRSAEWNYGPQKWMMNNLIVQNFAGTNIYDLLTVRLTHQRFEESRIDRDFNKSIRSKRKEIVNANSVNLDFNKVLSNLSEINYGMEAVINDVNSSGSDEDILTGITMPGPSRYPQSTWKSFAAYVTYKSHLSDQFLIQAGTRYNRYSLDAKFDTSYYPFPFTTAKINQGALNASFGVVLNPSDKWSFHSNFSTGFRSPNVDDMGKVFDSEPGSVVVPNPDLKAEYAYNAEIGIASLIDDKLKIEFSMYYTFLNNALVRRDFTLNGMDSIVYDGELSQVQAVQNAAEARVFGIQTGLQWKINAYLGFVSRFNYQKGEEELDDGTTSPSRHAAPWFGDIHLDFEKDKLGIDLYAGFSGSKGFVDFPEEEKSKAYIYAIDEDGNPWSPGWITMNIKTIYEVNADFHVSLGLENLLDKRYRPYSSGIVAPGRNFVTSVTASF